MSENENTENVTHETVERAENATGDHTDVDRLRADGLVDQDAAETLPDDGGQGVDQIRADGLPRTADGDAERTSDVEVSGDSSDTAR